MEWWEVLITLIGIGATGLSMYSAYKSCQYYKKSKHLATYTNTNSVCIEIQKIIAQTNQLSALSYSKTTRGVNFQKSISEHALEIKKSLAEIRKNVSVEHQSSVEKILCTKYFNTDNYLDLLVSAQKTSEGVFVVDDEFSKFQSTINKVQFYIKEQLDIIAEKIK